MNDGHMTYSGELRDFFEDLHISSDKWEPYFDIYENHIVRTMYNHPFNTPLVLVEVGVQKGGSLQMWNDYLSFNVDKDHTPSIKIYGIDVDLDCLNRKYATDAIEVVIGDQGDPAFWDEFLTKVPEIDIFIDDGGHYMNQQILTFEKVFPRIRQNGVYFCEDCHTSYMSSNGGGLGRRGTFIEYAKGYVDVLHYNWKEEMTSDLEQKYKIGCKLSGLHFYDSMVVFEKHYKKDMKRVFPKLFAPE